MYPIYLIKEHRRYTIMVTTVMQQGEDLRKKIANQGITLWLIGILIYNFLLKKMSSNRREG